MVTGPTATRALALLCLLPLRGGGAEATIGEAEVTLPAYAFSDPSALAARDAPAR